MATAKPSNEMPFGVGVVFTLLGGGIVGFFLFGQVLPAAWVYFAYRPVQGTVVETRPAEESIKHGTRHHLEALLEYTVNGKDYRGWVRLPRSTTEAEGPDAEAVRDQVAVGEQLTCYHDPIKPAAGVVLDTNRFEWFKLCGVLCPSLFLMVGLATVAAGWRKTFPRGVVVETVSLLGRLPRRFYLALAGVPLVIVTGWLILTNLVPVLGCWAFPVGLLTFLGVIALLSMAREFGRVALPSPEKRAIDARQPDLPPGASMPAPPPLPPWDPGPPVPVDRGERLPVRLRPNLHSLFSDPLVVAGLVIFFGSLVLGGWGLALVAAWLGLGPGPVRLGLLLLVPAIGATAVFVLGSPVVRQARRLAVEVSEHPLRPGGSYRFALAHPDAGVLARLQLALVSEEESRASGSNKGGNNTKRHTASRQAIDIKEQPAPDGALYLQCDVPAGAMPSFELGHHQLAWYFTVDLGRRFLGDLRYPVTVAPAAAPPDLPLPQDKPAQGDFASGSLWIDEETTSFLPGATLEGGCSVRPTDHPLRTAELSVLWYTADTGGADMGVCHYEGHEAIDGDDLPLYRERRFRVSLPSGPFNYDGEVVKVCWAVRLRLRYVNGEEQVHELPFRLHPWPDPGTPAVST
jgi:hypothetical protein